MGELNGYNANEWEPNASFDPVPAGEYTAVITESDWEQTKAGTGRFLKLKLQIVQGPHENRVLWDRLNLENPNQQAVEIAKRTLSAICRAVGRMTPKDSMELHNIPLLVRVAVKNREDTGEPTNDIKGYKPVGGSGPVVSQASAPTTKPSAPWERKK